MKADLGKTALQIVAMSNRGEVTLTGIELVVRDFLARGIAAQTAADAAIAAAQVPPDAK